MPRENADETLAGIDSCMALTVLSREAGGVISCQQERIVCSSRDPWDVIRPGGQGAEP